MANLNVRYAGFAAETAAAGAAAVNPQPSFYVDVAEAGIDSPTETDIEVPSSLGMTARAKRSGMYIPSGNIVYNTDIRTIGRFAKWGLMGYAFTAGSDGILEQQTLGFTAADVDGGTFTISLPDANGVAQNYNFTVAGGDTAAAISAQVAGGVFAGWTGADAAGSVVFTATTGGDKAMGTFTPGTSGVTGTFTQSRASSGGEFNTHEIWANDLRYVQEFCGRIGKDEFEHVFERAAINSFEISVERELVPVTVDMTASRDFEAVLKDVEDDIYPGLPAEYALAYHDINLRIDKDNAGTMIDVSDIAMSLTSTIENNLDSEAGVTLGSRFPRRHGSSGRNISLSSELTFKDMAMKRKFWGDLNGGLGVPGKLGGKNFPVEAYIDSGSTFVPGNYGDALIRYPNCYFNSVPLAASGREEMTQGVEMNVHTGEVTLADGVTVIRTPIYIRLRNRAPSML